MGKTRSNDEPLVLAYIGDTIYDLLVRTYLVMTNNLTVHSLHNRAINYVSAGAQAHTLEDIFERLTDEEKNIIRRGETPGPGPYPRMQI